MDHFEALSLVQAWKDRFSMAGALFTLQNKTLNPADVDKNQLTESKGR
jgi:hypothetical protein